MHVIVVYGHRCTWTRLFAVWPYEQDFAQYYFFSKYCRLTARRCAHWGRKLLHFVIYAWNYFRE